MTTPLTPEPTGEPTVHADTPGSTGGAPEPLGAETRAWTPPASDAPRRAVRPGTIVWGAVLIAVSIGLIAVAYGAVIDVQLTAIIGLIIAGVALIVGSVLAAMRRSRNREL